QSMQGPFFPESRMATRAMRRTWAPWSSAGRCQCTVRARSRISPNDSARRALFDLEEADHDLVRIALADANEQTLGEPLQVGRSRFKLRLSAEIDELWIDGLAREQLLHDVRRRCSNAAILHIDEIAFIRLDHVARVEFCETVRL